MNTKARIEWRHEQNGRLLSDGTREEARLSLDRPFVVGLPTEEENEWEDWGSETGAVTSGLHAAYREREGEREWGASGTESILGPQAVHFQSLDALMEFVLEVLTEDEVALTHRIVRERN